MMIRPLHASIAIVLAAIVGFAFARHSTPERVVERVRTVEAERKTEASGLRTSESEAVSTVVVRTIETRPDGTRIESSRHEAAKVEVRVEEKVVYRDVEKLVFRDREKIVENAKPQWRVGVELGIADAPHRVDIPGIPRHLPLVATATVERRIAGPFFLGASLSSTPALGARLSFEF